MIHIMRLAHGPFEKIRRGKKTFELRLYDEKRKNLSVGDRILFTDREEAGKKILVQIRSLRRFRSFQELYRTLPLDKCGYEPGEAASPRDMEAYYSPEEQARWGVVAIEMVLLDNGKNRERTHLSRYISYLLRHNPGAAGLTLDAHGWAEVEALICCVNKTRRLDRQLLEEIVAMDDKNRYSFSDDGTRIRANQGHSVQVDVELEELEPPEYLWHGTADRFLDSIWKYGLKPGKRLYVHLSPDPETAVRVGARHGNPVVLRVAAGQMYRDGFRFFRSVNGVWLIERVPAGYLEKNY